MQAVQQHKCYPGKTANILWCQHWFPSKMTSEEQVQKFRTDDVSLPISERCFWWVKANFPHSMNNQKHSTIPRSGYDTSSVWNFCTCSSAGEHPGFFLGAGAPPRNGVTKNKKMKKKTFVKAISYCKLLRIHIKQYSTLQCQTDIFTAFNSSTSSDVLLQHQYTTIFILFYRIPVVLLGRVPTPCTLPLDLPLLTDHFTGQPVVASWNVGCFLMLHWCETMYTHLIRIYLSIYLLILFKCFFNTVFCIQLRVPSLINVPAHIQTHSRTLLIQ